MQHSDPTYPLFPVFAFLSFFVVLVPLPWHLRAWNSGTCLFMIWTAIACLNQFVNSVVWHQNFTDWAPIWCDISTRLMVGISVAIPAASLCINRRLYIIATSRTATSFTHRRRAVMVDLAIGLGIPVLQMVLQFVVQGHRYDIFEDFGCYPTTVNTPLAYPLSFLWPNLISLISSIYCVLTLRAFMIRRAQFSQFVSLNSSLTMNRYFRLMCLAMAEICFTIPISTYGLYLNITSKPIYPWRSWSDIHSDWYTIDVYPANLFRFNQTALVTLELSRWSLVLCALTFFAFFGFADEARKNYKCFCTEVARRVGHFDGSTNRSTTTEKARFRLRLRDLVLPIRKNNTDTDTLTTLPTYTLRKSEHLPSLPKRDSCFSINTSHNGTHCGSDLSETVYGSPHAQIPADRDPTIWRTTTEDPSRLSRLTI